LLEDPTLAVKLSAGISTAAPAAGRPPSEPADCRADSTASNRDPPMNEGLPRTPERPFDCLPYRGKLRYSGRKVFQPRGDGDPLLGGTTRELSSVARGRSTDCDARAAAVPAKLSWDVPIYCSSDNAAGDTNPDNHID